VGAISHGWLMHSIMHQTQLCPKIVIKMKIVGQR